MAGLLPQPPAPLVGVRGGVAAAPSVAAGGGPPAVTSPRRTSQPGPPRRTGHRANEVELRIAPTAAHIWEACIQDPTHGRRLEEMISPHSDARVAEQAGFPARTLTGVCLLARAVSRLGRELELDLASVRRLAASFTSGAAPSRPRDRRARRDAGLACCELPSMEETACVRLVGHRRRL